jgi:transcriptional regulator with XRE-family HTH domain
MLNLQKIGNKITKARKEAGMTQNELSEALYVTHQAISKWENGKSIPSIEMLYAITKLFNISIDYLLNDQDEKATDYQTMFLSNNREVVLNHFYNQSDHNKEIPKIFYLLSKEERNLLLKQIISKSIEVDVKTLWPLLSEQERNCMLNNIISGKLDYNLNLIITMLTPFEQQIISNSYKQGNYPYPIYINTRR